MFLVFNAVLIPACHGKAVQDDITTKNVPIWLHHIVPKPIKGLKNFSGSTKDLGERIPDRDQEEENIQFKSVYWGTKPYHKRIKLRINGQCKGSLKKKFFS